MPTFCCGATSAVLLYSAVLLLEGQCIIRKMLHSLGSAVLHNAVQFGAREGGARPVL